MTQRITKEDRAAMRYATMACWWPSRAHPGQPVWSGIRNELELLAKQAEIRADWRGEPHAEAYELSRLAGLVSMKISREELARWR